MGKQQNTDINRDNPGRGPPVASRRDPASTELTRLRARPFTQTGVDGLANEFSRLNPGEAGGGGHLSRGDGPYDREIGDQDSSSSDEIEDMVESSDGDNGDHFDYQRLDPVDRIMESFCAALDSKIAALRKTETKLTHIKKEPGPEPEGGQAGFVGTGNRLGGKSLASRTELRKRYTGDKVAWAQPPRASTVAAPRARTPRQYGGTAPTPPVPAGASVAAQAAAPPPARLQLHDRPPQAPALPPLPQIPPSPLTSISNYTPPPPPPPPPAQQLGPKKIPSPAAPGTASRSRTRPIISPPKPATSKAETTFRRPEASRRLRSKKQDEARESSSPVSFIQSFGRALVGRGQPAPASESQEASILAPGASSPSEVTGSFKRKAKSRKPDHESHSSNLPSASTSSPISPDEEGNIEAIDSLYQAQPAGQAEELGVEDVHEDGSSLSYGMSGIHAVDDALPEGNASFVGSMTHQWFADTQFGGEGSFGSHVPMATTFHMPQMLESTSTDYLLMTETQHEGVSQGPEVVQPRKRVVCMEDSQHDTVPTVQEDGDGDGRRKKAKKTPSDTIAVDRDANRKFACPYFKRNPTKYRKWTSCPGPGWEEVHRVKTHLYRRHPLPIQCPRCWNVFKADSQLQVHLQQDPPCTVQGNRMLHEGFTKDQEKRLRSRKKTNADMTDEDKWREIYMILFPDDEHAIPSPYHCESDRESEGKSPSGPGELEDYATFIRREMPTLVRRELEGLFRDEFQDVEERIRPRVAEIVLNLQPRLLSLYKQSQLPLNEYGPQQQGDMGSGSEPTTTPLLSQATDSGAGTSTDSTPVTVFGTDNFFPAAEAQAAQLDPYGSGLDAWDTVYPGHQVQPQVYGTEVGLGLNWDFEFDQLLNPMVFMPTSSGYPNQTSTPLQHGQ